MARSSSAPTGVSAAAPTRPCVALRLESAGEEIEPGAGVDRPGQQQLNWWRRRRPPTATAIVNMTARRAPYGVGGLVAPAWLYACTQVFAQDRASAGRASEESCGGFERSATLIAKIRRGDTGFPQGATVLSHAMSERELSVLRKHAKST